MIRAVLFDMDGVLVDTEWFYSKRREAYLAECGITYGVFPDLTGISTAETWGAAPTPNDLGLRERLCEAYGSYCDAHPIPDSELLNDGVRDTFRKLHERGIKTAIASSSYRDMIEEVISVAGIRGLVDYVISGFECNAFKPDPEILWLGRPTICRGLSLRNAWSSKILLLVLSRACVLAHVSWH